MGYFPNGTAGACFEEQWCSRCIHGDRGCAVMDVHNFYNYDQFNDDERGRAIKSILDMLIADINGGQCAMFVLDGNAEAKEAERKRLAEQADKYAAAMAECRRAA